MWAAIWGSTLLVLFLGVCAAGTFAYQMDLEGVVVERLVILERMQFAAWAATVLVAGVGCFAQRSRRGVLLLVWIGMLSTLLGLRELDLQVIFNTEGAEYLGYPASWAISWKPAWWVSPETPVMVRVVWGTLLLGIGAMVVLPFARAKYPWPRALREGRPFAWLLVCGFAALGTSFVADDFVGRPLLEAGVNTGPIEESLELLGVIAVLSWVMWLASGHAPLYPSRRPSPGLRKSTTHDRA